MSLDDRIKQELENESNELDQIIVNKRGLFDLVSRSFKGGLGRWMILISIIIMAVSAFMLWAFYQFFTADSVDDRLFWGVLSVCALTAQTAMKLWSWMEINRNSLLREIKRVELAVARLDQKPR